LIIYADFLNIHLLSNFLKGLLDRACSDLFSSGLPMGNIWPHQFYAFFVMNSLGVPLFSGFYKELLAQTRAMLPGLAFLAKTYYPQFPWIRLWVTALC
jgi:hypothetical protein